MKMPISLQQGSLASLVNIFMVMLGVPTLVGRIVMGWFHLPSMEPGGWALLLLVAMWGGSTIARELAEDEPWGRVLSAGLLAGATQGVLFGVVVWGVTALVQGGADVRTWLVQITPEAIDLLTFGLPPLTAGLVACGAILLAGCFGTALSCAAARYHWRQVVREEWNKLQAAIQRVPGVPETLSHPYTRYSLYGWGLVLLLALPLLLNQYWNYTLGTVGIYVMLGIGLNIVVGLAGLLDLGYVAFFAIGSYTVALLTAPTPHGIQMSFWLVIPIGVILAGISGVLLGIPVLRMRGDYLAIVTLGFGEIIRILSKSDVLTSFTGGPRGVRAVDVPSLFGFDFTRYNQRPFTYFIILGIVLLVLVTIRLQDSRVGRAWMAMRDDEDVAQAVGIYTLRYKLLAFAIGAAFAGLGGGIFASRNQFTAPEDFALIVSINVLCLVIVGGMGSIPGVVMGALVLKGLPEVLRQLEDYRMLVFGALLVVMMILRPEGIWPSKRRRMELHEAVE